MAQERFINASQGALSTELVSVNGLVLPLHPTFPKPRELVLDHFAQRYIFQRDEDGTTQYERFFTQYPSLSKESRELLDFVIQRSTNVRVGVLKSVDYQKFQHAFQVIFLELSGKKEFEEPLGVLRRIYRVIPRGQSPEGEDDLRLIAVRYRQDGVLPKNLAVLVIQLTPDVLFSIERDIHKYLLLLKSRRYIAEIGKQYDGGKKLQYLLDYSSQLGSFNGSHLSQMVVGAGWEDKLKYFTDEDNVKKLKDLGFNGSHLSQMVVGAGWEDKLKYLLTHAEAVKDLIEQKKISAMLDIFGSKMWRQKADEFLGVN